MIPKIEKTQLLLPQQIQSSQLGFPHSVSEGIGTFDCGRDSSREETPDIGREK